MALLTLIVSAGACGSAPKLPPAGSADPDRWLFDRGTELLTDKKWFTSREYFRRLVDGYPQSPLRADAKLGIGDGYIGENTIESNILAVNEFREFLQFFPTNRRADYAQSRIALAYSRQILSSQRDQTATRDALREIDTFLQRYPDSPLKPEIQKLERQTKDRLSESEYNVGFFYYRFKVYAGALPRFKGILIIDPEFTRRDSVYFYLAECLLKIAEVMPELDRKPLRDEARSYFERVVAEFEVSKHLEDARKRIIELTR